MTPMEASASTELPIVGSGKFQYQPLPGWEQLPEGWSFVEVAAVSTDSHGNVHVFNRGEHPMMVFGRDGKFLRSWGEGNFNRPHGLHIAPDDTLYLTDDCDHTVRKYTPEGELLMTLGTSGEHSDTVTYKFPLVEGKPVKRADNVRSTGFTSRKTTGLRTTSRVNAAQTIRETARISGRGWGSVLTARSIKPRRDG